MKWLPTVQVSPRIGNAAPVIRQRKPGQPYLAPARHGANAPSNSKLFYVLSMRMKTQVDHIKLLRKWIAEGEHTQQDFKFLISDARKIARTLCSFANTTGGRILIGIKDNGGISGIRSDEEFYMIQTAAHLFTRPKVPFNCRVLLASGKQVLCVEVANSVLRPHLFRNEKEDWQAYFRLNDKDLCADAAMLRCWELERLPKGNVRPFGQAEADLLAYLMNDSFITLSECSNVTGLGFQDSVELLATLLRWEIIQARPHLDGVAYELKPN